VQAEQVMVREWEPRIATAREISTLVVTLNDALTVDLPDDPPWRDVLMREYLSVTVPGARRLSWVATEHLGDIATGGPILGMASVILMDGTGVVEVTVHPDARERGVGRALLTSVVAGARAEGLTSLGVEVAGDTSATSFYESFGFTRAFTEIRSVLKLDSVDWFALSDLATRVAAGYRLQFCPGTPPDDLIEAYAAAKASVQNIDLGDLDLSPSSVEPQRLRASLDTLHARGLQPYIVVAVHEATGDIVGLTEVVVPAQHPTRADQYDTIVVPEHRGYGVGRAINEPLIKVNQELGFVPDREWLEYEADVTDLAQRLGLR
jgi:ribosomal protein S18 acetylase RimI-like enzyme